MAVILDASNIFISNVCVAYNNAGDDMTPLMIKNIILNNVAAIKKRYIDKYPGNFILACDGKGYWRKDVYPYYKMKRADGRAASPMDWAMIFDTLNELYEEIQEFFPWHLVKVDGLEGDDIISILVQHLQTNELVANGVYFDEPQPIIIVSADKDFLQLQDYPNVSQYSPPQRKFLKNDKSPLEDKYLKIIGGDAGDGIVNIFSDDNCFAIGKRQTPASKKKVQPILESLMNTGELPDGTPQKIIDNFKRNKMLIDLVDLQSPPELKQKAIEMYESIDNSNKGKGLLYNYFVKNGMKNLLKDINKF